MQAGDLFVALVGEHSDGHHYLQQALQQGAAAVVVSKPEQVDLEQYPNYILVSDGVLFIQQLAHWLRQKTQIPVIAVTGSTGKTSTKDFLATILQTLGSIVVTKGNHNNELGLPLTICGLESDTKALVVEMGMRGLGQIDFLCQIANPDYGIITNIGKIHCELLGSQENIAQAKCELLPYIKEKGIIALNKKDEPFLQPGYRTVQGISCGITQMGRKGIIGQIKLSSMRKEFVINCIGERNSMTFICLCKACIMYLIVWQPLRLHVA